MSKKLTFTAALTKVQITFNRLRYTGRKKSKSIDYNQWAFYRIGMNESYLISPGSIIWWPTSKQQTETAWEVEEVLTNRIN